MTDDNWGVACIYLTLSLMMALYLCWPYGIRVRISQAHSLQMMPALAARDVIDDAEFFAIYSLQIYFIVVLYLSYYPAFLFTVQWNPTLLALDLFHRY